MDINEHTYIIFARKNYDEPLREIGTIRVETQEQVRDSALAAYPGGDWIEMIAVAQTAMVSALVEV